MSEPPKVNVSPLALTFVPNVMNPADPPKVAVLFGVHGTSMNPLTHQSELAVMLFQTPEPPLPGLA
jgi:hypothetical protein